ncbi:MAG: hypothetical protein ACKPKO_45215 [Candidatus Fonsibacter sp.]
MDENIAANQVQLGLPATEEPEESIPPSAPASSTTTPEQSSEEASDEEEFADGEPIWDIMFDKRSNANQVWLRTYATCVTGGYVINYSSSPRVGSRGAAQVIN